MTLEKSDVYKIIQKVLIKLVCLFYKLGDYVE